MKKLDIFLLLLIVTVFFTLIVDVIDVYFYNKFLRQNGVSFWSLVPPKMIFKYVTTYPGNTLTFFGFGPWIALLGYFYLDDLKEKFTRK